MKSILTTFALLFVIASQAQNDTAHKIIYTHVQIEPQFPGGPTIWERFLQKYNLKPALGTSDNVAVVSFLVDEEGKVSHVKIENADLIDKKLLKKTKTAIQKFPRWKSAVQNGKNVSFRATKYIAPL
jgi:hypothetical protein